LLLLQEGDSNALVEINEMVFNFNNILIVHRLLLEWPALKVHQLSNFHLEVGHQIVDVSQLLLAGRVVLLGVLQLVGCLLINTED